MPTTISCTFTAISAGRGFFAFRHCKRMEINWRRPHYWGLNLNPGHHSIQHGNWLMTCNTTLGGLRLKDEAAMDLGGMTPEVRPGRRAGVRLSTPTPAPSRSRCAKPTS